MTQALMMIFMLIFILGGNFYVIYRIWNMLPPGTIRIILVALGILLIISLFVGILANNVLPSAVASILYRAGTSWYIC